MGELIAALVVLLTPTAPGCEVLAAVDVVRERAWTTGDEALLAHTFADGAERVELSRLRAWRGRGVRLEGMETVRSSCHDRGPDRIEVVERLGPTTAVMPDGVRRELPTDAWDRRLVRLEFTRGWWRVAEVA